ncbi:MAG: hypothetical protein ACYDBW_13240 [Sulfuricaulis sp.]
MPCDARRLELKLALVHNPLLRVGRLLHDPLQLAALEDIDGDAAENKSSLARMALT